MAVKTKGWSDRRKKQQACNIRKQKPWQQSTGPKTIEGKARVRLNALKHGFDSAQIITLRRLLTAQHRALRKFMDGGL